MSSLTSPSQIAVRQLAYFEGKRVVIAGEIEDNFAKQLQKVAQSVTVFTTNFATYGDLKDIEGIDAQFGIKYNNSSQADMILLYWPKAKVEAQYLLEMLLDEMGEETEVCVVGENRSGVKSIEKQFAPFGTIKKYDSARRCSFYWGIANHKPKPFKLDDWYKQYSITYQSHQIQIKSLPGVFSHGEFDIGSQLLLDNLPALSGKVLDFGCGAGVIGTTIALLNPDVEIEMCDISAFAIESSKATLAANGLTGRVFASNVYSNAASDYNNIVSNPPFHSGLDTSYSATEQLLAKSTSHLTAKGQLYIVANSFLKYPPIIEKQFGYCDTLDKTKKFAIYSAQK